MAVVNLKKFVLNSMPDNAFVVATGKRRSGKTVLVTDILHSKRHVFPCGLVMSGTEESNRYYKSIVPDSFIFGAFDEDKPWKLIGRQKKIKDQDLPNGKVFVLLNDCAYDKQHMNSKVLKYLACNSRHLDIMVILTLQYMLDIPPVVRNNVDVLFAFADNNHLNQRKLYDHYFGNFESIQVFKDVFRACTANYEVLVLNNVAKTGQTEDTVFYYKAATHKPFRIGHKAFWAYHDKTYGGTDAKKGSMIAGTKVKVRKE
jgi:hypothetical protein